MRRRTDKPTENELRLLTDNHRLGARILELERAAEIDAANLKNCFENREAERGFLAQLQRDYAALEAEHASLGDFLNSWARQERVEQAASPSEVKAVADRLWVRFNAVVSENRAKCLELAEKAGDRDGAARELLFLAGVEGIASLSRGGKGCVFQALEHLRPDIAALWKEHEDPFSLLQRFFPEDGA